MVPFASDPGIGSSMHPDSQATPARDSTEVAAREIKVAERRAAQNAQQNGACHADFTFKHIRRTGSR
jgi:hypothetical protein